MHVLLIEEDPTFTRLVESYLNTPGSGVSLVTAVSTLAQAETVLATSSPDVVLIDLFLSDSGGRSSVQQLYARHPRLAIVVLTGRDDVETAVEALREGAQDYLVKVGLQAEALTRSLRYAVERKRITDRLRDSEARSRAILEGAVEPIITCDAKGVIELANDATTRLFGYGVHELVGRPITDLLAPPFSEWCGTWLQTFDSHADEASASHPREVTGQRKDGSTFPMALALSQVQLEQRTLFIATVHDLTVMKQAEETRIRLENRLLQSQRMESLAVLAGGIAHRFNNHLQAIVGNLEMALLDLPDGSATATSIREAMAVADRAGELGRQMLAFSGRGNFVVRRLNLNAVLKEIRGMLEVLVGRNAVLEYELGDDVPDIETDRDQWMQVLINLVSNAAEALPNKVGTIRLRTYRWVQAVEAPLPAGAESLFPGTYAALDVTDNGVGMDEATRKRAFDPFFTTKFAGRGLGLAAVSGIVRAQRGSLGVVSAPGQGATFTVYLPSQA